MKFLLRSLLLSAALVAPVLAQDTYYAGDYESVDYGNGPLEDCGFSLEFRGGIAPTIWRQRSCLFGVDCVASTSAIISLATSPVVAFGEIPSFKDHFKLPWTFGVHFGYALSECVELGLEFNYIQAKERSCVGFNVNQCCTTGTVLTPRGTNLALQDPYRAFSGYVSARYYLDWFCGECFHFFVGSKVGVEHLRHINALITVANPIVGAATTTGSACFSYIDRSTMISGGVHLGFDWAMWECLKLVFTAEVVATGAPRTNTLVNLSSNVPSIGFSNLVIGTLGTQIHFPITLGLKYTF